MGHEDFLERLIQRLNVMDTNSVQAFIMKLAREKGFLEAIFNTINEGILIVDKQLKINYCNRAAIKLLGLPDDLQHVRISQFLKEINWQKVLDNDAQEWQKLARSEIEILYPEKRILQFYLVPHEQDHSLASVILLDVTENKQQTIDQIESQKLQVISMLAASVAHEIGNPLNSLSLHLQLLEQEILEDSFDKEDALNIIRISKSEIERLDVIINQFLKAIRPGSLHLECLKLTKVLGEALHFMRHEIENKKVVVSCNFAETIPSIKGDKNALKQAFYNILKNAIQAMTDGGKLTIDCRYENGEIELTFTDTGTGINSKNFTTIFEPFSTSKENGSGLGLMIVDRIIREHGGDLSIVSEEGKGTSVIIKFYPAGRRIRVLSA
ncbi:ATP-binding protein [Lentisphaerota bacterium WC36G]|nr:PAS domain-containing protein [Lentisphaerae bacterium WC36]